MEPVTMTTSLLTLGLDAGTLIHDQGDEAPAPADVDSVPDLWDRFRNGEIGVDADHGIALFAEPDGIEDDGETAFFEADIWAVYDSDGERRWVSRCPDFARRNERRKDVRTAADAAEEGELVAQFDMADEPISRKLGVSPAPSYMQESANEQVRRDYLERIRELVDA